MPTAVTVNVPSPNKDAPKSIAFASVMPTLLVPELFRLTAPVKSLPALVRVITPAPALKIAAPADDAWVMAPLCVMPTAVTVNAPSPNKDAPKSIAFASVMPTLLAPELFKLNEPVKLLPALVSVITPAPALMVTVPADDA